MRKGKQGRKGRNDKAGFAMLFDESVVEEAVKIMASASPFLLPDGSCVCLRFHSSSVEGGLTKKNARKNQEVGKFVSAVTAHRLHTFITENMLVEDYFLIIPTERTVVMMSEYDFLLSSTFPLTLVDRSGLINHTSMSMSFNDVRNVASSRVSITEFFPVADDNDAGVENNYGGHNGHGEIVVEQESNDDFVNAEIVSDNPAEQLIDNSVSAVEETSYVQADEASVSSVEVVNVGSDAGVSADNALSVGAVGRRRRRKGVSVSSSTEVTVEEVASEHDVESATVSSYSVEQTMERRFFSTEVSQTVTSEAFDAMFRQGPVQIAVPENSGWLDDVVRYETIKANEALVRFHEDMVERLRRQFLDMLEEQYSVILDKTSLDENSLGVYGQRMRSIVHAREEALASLPERVEHERARIRERYDEELRGEIERVTSTALNDFKVRRGKTMVSELEGIPAVVEREIDSIYHSNLAILKKDRREQVTHLMDRATAKVLRKIGFEYQNALESEAQLRDKLIRNIAHLSDENRENEMHRVNVLEAELNRDTQLERLSREHSARLESMRQDFESTNSALRSEYDSVLLRHSEELDELMSRHSRELEKKDEENDVLRQELQNLHWRFEHVAEEKRGEVAQELQHLYDTNVDLGRRLEAVVSAQRKTSWFGGVAIVVATVVAGVIGAVIGHMFL